MKRLAKNTPASVASVGMRTSATMLKVSDQDRASLMAKPPTSTTGRHPPSASRPSCISSCGVSVAPPEVTAAPYGLHAMVVAEFRA